MRRLLGRSRRVTGLAAGVLCCLVGACSDFNTTRDAPPRGTLGHELFAVICDRVGAQALREDVTGASFHAVCHADANGNYSNTVDQSLLPPLSPTTNLDGQPVTVAEQIPERAHNVARIEALARDRSALIAAIDSAIPATTIPRLENDTATDSSKPCSPAPGTGPLLLQAELSRVTGNLIDLYNDETIPQTTEATGYLLDALKANPNVQNSLAIYNGRQGYRPLAISLGVVRPVLAYPRFVDFTRSLLSLLEGTGDAGTAWTTMQQVLYNEMRSAVPDATVPPLTLTTDPVLGREILSRPRTSLEVTREMLLVQGAAFASGSPNPLVQRDSRGYAVVPLVNGSLPSPFVDANGDGLPDVDALGQFVTSTGTLPVTPFLQPGQQDGPRDSLGRALLDANQSTTLYTNRDVAQTSLGAIVRDIKPFFAVDPTQRAETAMNFLAAVPVLAGGRDSLPMTTKVYPPDPSLATDWPLTHTTPPPAGLGSTPVTYTYAGFHADTSPLVDLLYAAGQILPTEELDEMLVLLSNLVQQHPEQLASMLGMMLEIRAIADKHPEAQLPATSTLWDDLFVTLSQVAHQPGLVEDILRGVANPQTLPIEKALATYLSTKDDIRYDTNNVNGPSINITTNTTPPDFVTPVDRSQPDTGSNRSLMQQFLQLLHDTNGLAICTKDGAEIPIEVSLGALGSFNFVYPGVQTSDQVISSIVCGIVGSSPPANSHLDQCAVFAYQNVMSLLLGVLLGDAQLTVRDPCMNALLNSSLPTLVGGANSFLEQISGVQGFSLNPNLRGFARLLYFEVPYPGLPTDPNATVTLPAANGGGALTATFLGDTINPIPSMVCDQAPFTASDGTYFPLRSCANVGDTLRGRDRDALFPVDELGFVASLGPLASAFQAHNQPLLFAALFDNLHVHYGSVGQSTTECDPTLPHTCDGTTACGKACMTPTDCGSDYFCTNNVCAPSARWCPQDGLSSWEPLFVDVLNNGVFARVQSFLNTLASMQVPHCTATDPNTHVCTASTMRDGITVLAQMMDVLFESDPHARAHRSPGQHLGAPQRRHPRQSHRRDQPPRRRREGHRHPVRGVRHRAPERSGKAAPLARRARRIRRHLPLGDGSGHPGNLQRPDAHPAAAHPRLHHSRADRRSLPTQRRPDDGGVVLLGHPGHGDVAEPGHRGAGVRGVRRPRRRHSPGSRRARGAREPHVLPLRRDLGERRPVRRARRRGRHAPGPRRRHGLHEPRAAPRASHEGAAHRHPGQRGTARPRRRGRPHDVAHHATEHPRDWRAGVHSRPRPEPGARHDHG